MTSTRWSVVGLGAALMLTWLAIRGLGLDLRVYLSGGSAMLHGRDLYDLNVAVRGYGFTYPPFAALPMAVLAPLPTWLAQAITAAVFFAALLVVLECSVPGLLRQVGRSWPATLVVLAAGSGQPVWETLRLGQVNMVLAALVLWDLRPGAAHRGRGALVGVAAGIKLTPALFVVYLALRRDWTAVRNAVAGFAGTVALGFAIAPHDSVEYWGRELFQMSRVGDAHRIPNQSLQGMLLRELPSDSLAHTVWIPLAVVAVVAALYVADRLAVADQPVLALGVVGVGSCLVSPVAWTHHWVWFVAIVCVLLTQRDRAAQVAGRLVVLALLVGCDRVVERPVYETVVGKLLLGNLYLWATLPLLGWLAVTARRSAVNPAPRAAVAVPR